MSGAAPGGRGHRGRGPPRRRETATKDELIKNFVIRNSRNGFFTRVHTIATKFETSDDEAWSLIGMLLADNSIECVHDSRGEVKLCEAGRSMHLAGRRRRSGTESGGGARRAPEHEKRRGRPRRTSSVSRTLRSSKPTSSAPE